MRTSTRAVFVLLTIALAAVSCHKKKPTQPQPQAFAVTLNYHSNFQGIYCFRLVVGANYMVQCDVGETSRSIWAGDYDCRLYSVTNPGPDEVLTLVATSPLHLDRNFTCVIESGRIYWMYWGKKAVDIPRDEVAQPNAE